MGVGGGVSGHRGHRVTAAMLQTLLSDIHSLSAPLRSLTLGFYAIFQFKLSGTQEITRIPVKNHDVYRNVCLQPTATVCATALAVSVGYPRS